MPSITRYKMTINLRGYLIKNTIIFICKSFAGWLRDDRPACMLQKIQQLFNQSGIELELGTAQYLTVFSQNSSIMTHQHISVQNMIQYPGRRSSS